MKKRKDMNETAPESENRRPHPKQTAKATQHQARECEELRHDIDSKATTPLKETNPAADADQEAPAGPRNRGARQPLPSPNTTSGS